MSSIGRLLLADGDSAFLDSAMQTLRSMGCECRCVGGVRDAEALLSGDRIDVLVTEADLHDGSGLDMIERARVRGHVVPAVVASAKPSLASAQRAMRWAAVDYLAKPVGSGDLKRAVGLALERARCLRVLWQAMPGAKPSDPAQLEAALQAWLLAVGMEPGILASVPAQGPDARRAQDQSARVDEGAIKSLSPREQQVLWSIAGGKRASEIAALLGISPFTVRNHLKAIFRKLGVHSQLELLSRVRFLPSAFQQQEPAKARGQRRRAQQGEV